MWSNCYSESYVIATDSASQRRLPARQLRQRTDDQQIQSQGSCPCPLRKLIGGLIMPAQAHRGDNGARKKVSVTQKGKTYCVNPEQSKAFGPTAPHT